MITRIITNHIKEGHKEEYIKVSKAFCAAMLERDGCLEAKVYDVEGDDTLVIYVERWPDLETADGVMKNGTFGEFVPQLFPHFAGNETLVLHEA